MNNFDWTITAVDRLRVLRAEGHSAAQIATSLGLEFGTYPSRNAVLGKVMRLKLPKHERVRTPSERKRKPRPAKGSGLGSGWKPPQPKVTIAPAADAALPPDQSSFAVVFTELRRDHCRWVLGDTAGAATMFCGADRMGTASYCGRHCRIAYAPSRVREAA